MTSPAITPRVSAQRFTTALTRDPIALLIAAGFLVGLGHLFLTPPFEGFDETAHYASIQIVADEGRIPDYGRDRLAGDVADYLRAAPGPYAAIPPYDVNQRQTYAAAFEGAESEAAARAAINEAPDEARRYVPEGALNWQAQHPPIAYVLLAPVYAATRSLDWKTHLFLIRLACFAAATAGLAIGAAATRRHLGAPVAGAIIAAWPFYSPMYFPEMARLGNDAFCLLFMGLAWAALLRLLGAPPSPSVCGAPMRSAAKLGFFLGLGALTKAFFLPVAAGICLYLAARGAHAEWRPGGKVLHSARRALLPPALVAAVFVLVAGWWYAMKLAGEGSLTGANDFILLEGKGDFGAMLAHHFSIALFASRVASVYLSFVWAGTWSFAAAPFYSVQILGLAFAIVILAWVCSLYRNHRWLEPDGAPLFIVAPVVMGLLYHVLTQIALGPEGVVTPGWYLHIFAAPLGFAAARGAQRLWSARYGRAAVLAFLAGALSFGALVEFYQLTLFSGCSTKAGDDRAYAPLACFGDVGEIWRRLEVVANPAAGAAAFALGAATFVAAALLIMRKQEPDRRAVSRSPAS